MDSFSVELTNERPALNAGPDESVTEIMAVFGLNNSGVQFINNGEPVMSASYENGKEYSAELIGSGVTEITLNTVNAEIITAPSDNDTIYISYICGSAKGITFTAECSGNSLVISEKVSLARILGIGIKAGRLTVKLPVKKYASLTCESVSGNCSGETAESERFCLSSTSGSCWFNIKADDITVKSISGEIGLRNTAGGRSRSVSIKSGSGKVLLDGIKADELSLASTSGSVTANGLAGKISVSSTSGNVSLSFSEWDGDMNLKMTSGKGDITLPAGSGIDLDLHLISGSAEIALGSSEAKLTGSSKLAFGEENKHNVRLDLTSGKIRVHN